MRRWVLGVLFAVLAGAVLWFGASQVSEPVYQGKPLKAWLDDCDRSWWVGTERRTGQEALRQIGTKAIPGLLWRLRCNDSSFKLSFLAWASKHNLMRRISHTQASAYNHKGEVGFEALGQIAKDATPALVQIFEENISPDSQRETAIALGWIGPSARDALPTLIEASTNANCAARAEAVWALTRIGGEAERLVPVFVSCAADPWYGFRGHAMAGLYGSIRSQVVVALGAFGKDARKAIPTLVPLLNDLDGQVRQAATNALKAIDPGIAAGAGAE